MRWRIYCVGFLYLITQGTVSYPEYGRTHFIVGQEGLVAVQETRVESKPTVSKPSHVSTYFSPDDDLSKRLQDLIDREKKSIKIAVYMITEKNIANALIAAKNRGVEVELISDAGCLRERTSKIGHMCENGCKVFIYNPSYLNRDNSSLMHHKFALFSDNGGEGLIWTGSFNFTKAAGSNNQENAIILNDKDAFARFNNQFEKLKTRSYLYGNHRSGSK